MTKDQHLQDQEDQYQEALVDAICNDAAAFVIDGYTREQAVEKAKAINQRQQEADTDPTSALATLAEAQSPTQHAERGAQIAAIADELREEFF
ncbi:hypothetical protein [Paraburkholderia tropica]|uniref:hypothetical protein n=1 Tax=Paraburkholderia tropica TaxID=92647 RepID=UPI002AB75480|nr:hypothetical protein [Paraburkholderia tropica]